MDWAQGYVADIPYTPGHYAETAPHHIALAGLQRRLRMPDPAAPLAVCDLGCGQGFGTALLAAGLPRSRFWGIDFHPGQIANARRLADEAGLGNATFLELSFAEANALPDGALPEFDVIALHGIYAWVSEENRAEIRRFLRRRLRPGGVVYLSYNSLPGAADMVAVQHVAREFARRNPGRSDERVVEAMQLAAGLGPPPSRYFAAYPDSARKLEEMAGLPAAYLAHEYLNAHWRPFFVTEVAEAMGEARLGYAASATLADNVDAAFLADPHRPLAGRFPDPAWAELVKDMVSNKRFRRDLYLRGVNPLRPAERLAALEGFRFALTVPAEAASFRFESAGATMHGEDALYGALVAALAEGPRPFAALAPVVAAHGAEPVVEALCLLAGSGQLLPLGPAEEAARESARGFNDALARRARLGEFGGSLAVPGGGGLRAGPLELMVRAARLEGLGEAEIPRRVAAMIRSHGVDGPGEAEALAALEEPVRAVLARREPLWRRLGIG